MSRDSAAIAVFVKTPGLSPLKTRLAEGIGRERADEFYGLSLAAVEATVATVAESCEVCPYWAVAEEAGLESPRWQRFARVCQGNGDLGDRLGRVFADLLPRHQVVVAIGADSPQITPSIIQEAVEYLRQDSARNAHVLGRCHDGGFYLFGANHAIAPAVWNAVPFGRPDTAAALVQALDAKSFISELPVRSDVDRADDLANLARELRELTSVTAEQQAVLTWATRICGQGSSLSTSGF